MTSAMHRPGDPPAEPHARPRAFGAAQPARHELSRRARRLRTVGDVVGTLTITSVVVVVMLWLGNGNVGDFGTPGGAASALGRLTGLISADLLLIQVLLMARIPLIEQVWGQDDLTRRHRLVGFISFWAMGVHVVLITIGYAQAAHINLFAQAWDLLIDYPGMLLAGAGTVALVAVVVTSIRRARRRMRYSSWHLIHLYAYLGVGLALPHQLWTGQDFLASPLTTVYWWTLWAAAAAAVVCFRLILPLVSSVRHRLVVTGVKVEASGIFTITMKGRNLHLSGMRAGQYCQWRFLTGRGWSRPQPFSLSAMPTPEEVQITVQRIGVGTERLAAVKPGTKVHFEGPYGVMTADRRTRRDVLLIGAGVGITPMRGLAQEISREEAAGHAASVVVVHRVHGPEQAAFVDEFTAMHREALVRVVPLVGPRSAQSGWLPKPGHIDPTTALRNMVPDVAGREVYICGPAPWARAVRHTIRAAGVPRHAVHLEDFAT